MLKKKFMEWALSALMTYLEENGEELAQKALAWVLELIGKLDGDDMQIVGSTPAPEGCEGFCIEATAKLEELRAAA